MYIDTEGFSNFEKSPTANYVFFDVELFKETYNDPTLTFFQSLFTDASVLLIKALRVLDTAVKNNDKQEWSKCILGIYSICKTLFFMKVQKCPINTEVPSNRDYHIIKRCVHHTFEQALYELATINKVKTRIYFGKWCCWQKSK